MSWRLLKYYEILGQSPAITLDKDSSNRSLLNNLWEDGIMAVTDRDEAFRDGVRTYKTGFDGFREPLRPKRVGAPLLTFSH